MSSEIAKKLEQRAELVPDQTKSNVVFASRAEQQVYDCFERKLSSGWTVFYSVVLSQFEGDAGLRENEIDFLLYHPRYGIVVLEVKGGMIGYDSVKNQYHSKNRFGKVFKIKDPFEQAQVWKSRFIRMLKKNHITVPVTHAVCLPGVRESDLPEKSAVPKELLLGANGLGDPESFFSNLATKSHPTRFLKFNDCRSELRKLLTGGDFQSKLHLRAYIDAHEHSLSLSEDFQKHFVEPIAAQRRLGVEGEAGTGKSLLIKEVARYLSRGEAERVLVLSSNPVLNLFFRENLAEHVEVRGYIDFAKDLGVDLLIAPSNFEGEQEDWVQYEGPDRLRKKVEESERRYDAILCDEAQDVQPFWWDVISAVLQGEDSRLYVFFDRSQGIFGSSKSTSSFEPESVLPVPLPYFPLVSNYRMTGELQQFSKPFRTGTGILTSRSSRAGYVPELILYKDKDDAQAKLTALVTRLTVSEGVRPEEIALLSARRPLEEPSVLSGLEQLAEKRFYQLGKNRGSFRDHLYTKDELTLATVLRFKGLETRVSLLINFSEYNLPLSHALMSNLFYVAATRARHMSYIFLQQDDDKVAVIRKALAGVRSAGALVLTKVDGDETLVDDQGWVTATLVHIDSRGFLVFEFGHATQENADDGEPKRAVLMAKDLRDSLRVEKGRMYEVQTNDDLGIMLVSGIREPE